MEALTCAFCKSTFSRPRPNGRLPRYCSTSCRTQGHETQAVNGGPRSWPRSPEIEAQVCAAYLSGLSCESLKAQYRVNGETIRRVLRRNNIQLRSRNASTARKRFKNGRILDRTGYVWLLLDHGDPLYCMATQTWGKGREHASRYALEHRVVMARQLGRPLYAWENVHHRNGRRADNDPANLELWIKPQPLGQRAEDLARWVLDTYPDMVRDLLPREGWAAA